MLNPSSEPAVDVLFGSIIFLGRAILIPAELDSLRRILSNIDDDSDAQSSDFGRK